MQHQRLYFLFVFFIFYLFILFLKKNNTVDAMYAAHHAHTYLSCNVKTCYFPSCQSNFTEINSFKIFPFHLLFKPSCS